MSEWDRNLPIGPDNHPPCDYCDLGVDGAPCTCFDWEQLRIEEIHSEIPGVKAFAVTRPLPDGSREIVEWQYFAMPVEREYTLSIPIDYR